MNENIASEAVEVEALLLSRAYLWELFHKALGGYPSAELVEALRSQATLDVVDEYAADDATMAGLGRFLGGLAKTPAATFADELTGEYTRLFVGPGRPEAFPTEAPYVSGEATYFQENTVHVRAAYRARGFEPSRVGHVPDDHVALECALMARLAADALAALQGGDADGMRSALADALTFSKEHLGWLEKFALACRRSSTARLYPQLVEALAAFSKADATFMGESIAWLDAIGAGELAEARVAAQAPAAFSAVESALEGLRSLRLLGLEENELVTI